MARPAQLAELSRSEFDPELVSHNAYVKFFCDIRDKTAGFNIEEPRLNAKHHSSTRFLNVTNCE